MKRPQDASWNMVSINPQLVAVTAKLENIEVKLSSFFLSSNSSNSKILSSWNEWGGRKGGNHDLKLSVTQGLWLG